MHWLSDKINSRGRFFRQILHMGIDPHWFSRMVIVKLWLHVFSTPSDVNRISYNNYRPPVR